MLSAIVPVLLEKFLSDPIGYGYRRRNGFQTFFRDCFEHSLILETFDTVLKRQITCMNRNDFTDRPSTIRYDDLHAFLHHFKVLAQVNFRISDSNTCKEHKNPYLTTMITIVLWLL